VGGLAKRVGGPGEESVVRETCDEGLFGTANMVVEPCEYGGWTGRAKRVLVDGLRGCFDLLEGGCNRRRGGRQRVWTAKMVQGGKVKEDCPLHWCAGPNWGGNLGSESRCLNVWAREGGQGGLRIGMKCHDN